MMYTSYLPRLEPSSVDGEFFLQPPRTDRFEIELNIGGLVDPPQELVLVADLGRSSRADASLEDGEKVVIELFGDQRLAFKRNDFDLQFELPGILGDETQLDRDRFLVVGGLDFFLGGATETIVSCFAWLGRALSSSTRRTVNSRSAAPSARTLACTTTVFFTKTVGLTSRSSMLRSMAEFGDRSAPTPTGSTRICWSARRVAAAARIDVEGGQGPLGPVGEQQDADDLLSSAQFRQGRRARGPIAVCSPGVSGPKFSTVVTSRAKSRTGS